MRLYLSSYRLGNHADQLYSLVRDGRRVAIIKNATDFTAQENRVEDKTIAYDIDKVFRQHGFMPSPFDLRNYFNGDKNIYEDLRQFDLIWVCGGNAFLLRRAMQQSGFDDAIKKLVLNDDVVYGGWSAGICVLGPTLKGIELCDPPHQIAEGYNSPVIWEGLGLIDYSIAPHFRSDHPESEMIENVVSYFKNENMPYTALRDGEIIIYNGNSPVIFELSDSRADNISLTNLKSHHVPN